MHELSLAESILDIVEQAARRERFARVRQLTLEVGRLAGVDAGALRFALEAVAPGTRLAGAVIRIDEPAGEVRCFDCARPSTADVRGGTCPHCGSARLETVAGSALRVTDLLVDDG